MGFKLSEASLRHLEGVHPDLVRVVMRAAEISPIRFRVVEGLRTLERQRELKRTGMSKTLNSRHLTGHAVDIVPDEDLNNDGRITTDELYHHSQLVKLSPHIKRAFRECGVPYEWGGDWRNAWDKPHWQLPWKQYPIRVASLGDDPLMEAFVEPPMETPTITDRGARLMTEVTAGGGSAAMLIDSATKLGDVETRLNAGTIFGFVIGAMILTAVGVSLYTSWDAAGRPLPWKRRSA